MPENNDEPSSSFSLYYDAAMAGNDESSPLEELYGCLDEESYEDIEKIGEGGMKVIFSCRDSLTGRLLARAYPKDTENSQLVERFIREARLMAELEHPNIVPVHRIGVEGESKPYFTMKLIDGESLKLKSFKLNLNERIDVFIKVCHAVSYAHSHQILHLDIKPDNISVSHFGEVLLMDWGLARRLGDREVFEQEIDLVSNIEASLAGQVKGTPEYMSPEQAFAAKDLDEKSDIYSLGSLLYFLLSAHSPYSDSSAEDVLQRVQLNDWQSPSQRFADLSISPSLEAILKHCMALSVEDRYDSVDRLRQDVESWRNGFSPKAEQASFARHLLLLVQRHRTAVFSLLLFLSLLVIISFSFIHSLKQRSLEAVQERDRALAAEKQATDHYEAYRLEEEKKKQISGDAAPRIFNEAITAYGELTYEEAMQRRDYQRALENVNKAVSLDPSLSEAWELKAKLHIGRLEFNELAQCLFYLKKNDFAHEVHQRWQDWQTPEKLSPIEIKKIIDILAKRREFHTLRHLCSGAFLAYPLEDHLKLSLHAMARRDGRKISNTGTIKDGLVDLNLYRRGYANLTALTSLPLRKLSLSRNRVTWLDPLSKQKHLEELDVSYSNVHDLFPLWTLPIKKLNLRGTRVTNYSIHMLKDLEELHVGLLRPFSLRQLMRHPTLKVLYVPKGLYHDSEIKSLKKKLKVELY